MDKTMLVDTPMLEQYYRKQAQKFQALWENAKDEKQAQQIYLNLMPLQAWIARKDYQQNGY